jgi:hypothetical protein
MTARSTKPDSEARITKKKASQIIRQHLIQEIPRDFDIYDGVPFGIKYYNMPNEPCWTILISRQVSGVGSSRIICVSKKTGKVIYDGITGDE